VAQPSLIQAYLTELRYSTARLAHNDDIVAEAEDHLLCSVEAGIARGLSTSEAEADALARFGSAPLVANTFIEEDKRGGAVSTQFTRRAGLAAMFAPLLLVVGELGNENIDRGALHGGSLFLVFLGFVGFAVALWGVRKRHGGLGGWGRAAFWLFVAAPFLSVPFGYGMGFAWIGFLLVVVTLVGIGMIRARILPAGAAWLFTLAPAMSILTVLVAVLVAENPDDYNWYPVVGMGLFAVALAWIGWAMWQEPALDVRGRAGTGPLATT